MSAQLELEVRRFCSTRELAELFGFSEHWIYSLNRRGKGPPPLPDLKPYRYDTQSKAFKDWLTRMGVEVETTVDSE